MGWGLADRQARHESSDQTRRELEMETGTGMGTEDCSFGFLVSWVLPIWVDLAGNVPYLTLPYLNSLIYHQYEVSAMP